jgi:hypothetical protein
MARYRFSAIPGEDRNLPGGMVTRGLHSLYAEGMRIYHGPDTEAMVGSLLYWMRALSFDYLDEFIRIRGGAVAVADGGLLLASTEVRPELGALVATLLTKGAASLGDEVALVDPVLRRIHPSPFPILLDLAEASRFPGIAPTPHRRSRRAMAGRYALSVEALGNRSLEPAPVRWIVLLSFEPGQDTTVEPAGGAEAVFGLSRACANLDVWEDRALALFRELAEGVTLSRLVVGSVESAADLVVETASSLFAR